MANTSFFVHNFYINLIRKLKNYGYEVKIVSPEDDYTVKLKEEGLEHIPIKNLNRKGSNPVEDIRLFFELYRVFRTERPDLALLFTIKINTYGGIAAGLVRVKTICTVTGLGWLFTEKSLKTFIGGFGYKILYKISFAHTTKVIFQNRDDREFFIRNRLLKEEKALITPGVGVDTNHFNPEFCKNINKNKDSLVFLLMSRMLWDKGIGEFVEAAKIVKDKYPSTEFWLLGPMDYENRSAIPESLIHQWEHEGWIKYKGETSEVRPFICQCDVMVLPSYREAIGKSLLEAMSMGKPIIATDTAGCRDTIEQGKNGFLVKVKDNGSLAVAMLSYIELTSEEKIKMGEYSRKKVINEFNEKLVHDTYIGLIKDVRGYNI
ncbi:MAG: glycosyltransferase family 4 protein [Syntrophorhabdaceae bacterium]|nr:glycosyltransferase family 4 protein [Syntrophorhabdaceae bacterium]